jgi:spore coat protein H
MSDPGPETRNPKPEIRKKAEGRNPKEVSPGCVFRLSGFGFLSAFGLRPSDFCRVSSTAVLCVLWSLSNSSTEAATVPGPCPGADLFTDGAVRRVELAISSQDAASLRQDPRKFIRATVSEGEKVFHDVALHLKGSVGSFRPLDDKPGFTLDFSRFNSGQKFHGLRRIHLNNSVEDPSYCNEQLGSELFRQAGLPAPRVTHALVSLNGRRLGMYVLKEGFTEDFLSCYFNKPGGDLFEPGEGHDVNQHLKRTSIAGTRQGRDCLTKLAAACLEPNPALRWEELGKVLDRERFITFMALEVMLCHRDGYCLARNNFRVYHDVDKNKVVFFPHGMDQLFGSADLPWQPHLWGLVAKAVVETPEGKQWYRERFTCLFSNLFQVELLAKRANQIVSLLRPFLTDSEFTSVRAEAGLVNERMQQRQLNLGMQLTTPELRLLEFRDGVARLRDWVKTDRPASGDMEQATSPDGVPALHIVTRTDTLASWRTKARLARGHYRFTGKVKVAGVQPLSYGAHQGAGLRLSGSARQSANLTGDSGWRELQAEFDINNEVAEVELICELRASRGEAWFDLASLCVSQRL